MSETENNSKQYQRALNKVADILARRNHSEKELRDKMGKFFEPALIDEVVAEAWKRKWLTPPEDLALDAAKSWGRTLKSAEYIRTQLKLRGLPLVPVDEEEELEKIKTLLRKKFRFTDPEEMNLNYEERLKAYRLLKYRGFDDNLIRKVIPDEF